MQLHLFLNITVYPEQYNAMASTINDEEKNHNVELYRHIDTRTFSVESHL